MKTAKLAGSAVVASALLLSSAGLAFAQTNTSTTGVTSTGTTGSMTASTTGTTGTTGSTTSTTSSGTTGTTGTSATTPGTPNTGAGGDATTNALVLAASALAVVFGGTFLARKAAFR